MNSKILFFLNRLRERLWIKPLVFCLLSIAGALLAHMADDNNLQKYIPEINPKSVEDLLSTLSSSMLVISIFAVASMIAAYSAASNTATPRSFPLIVSDDVSQNALSVFIGAFIFSIVATVAMQNGYYGKAGNFTLLVLTLIIFMLVIFIFLRWVERIARLGRMGETIKKIEKATAAAIEKKATAPLLYGMPIENANSGGIAVKSKQVGYIQHIDMEMLQKYSEDIKAGIRLACLPGSFVAEDRALLFITSENKKHQHIDFEKIDKAFTIGDSRVFDEDPRFGLVALSEVASRALSPGINDPGTAIAILSCHVRLFTQWINLYKKEKKVGEKFKRVQVPALSMDDMLEDAFRPICRDGASNIEVMIKLQKSLRAISAAGNEDVKELAKKYSRQAWQRANETNPHQQDLISLKHYCL